MNGGPYRAPQPADRRVINRTEPSAYRQQQEEVQPVVKEEPRVSARPTSSLPPVKASNRKSKTGLLWTVGLVVFALLVGVFGGYVWASANGTTDTGIDSKKYQAVYLMNGQLYFGKLGMLDDSRFKLSNVYYLQAGTNEDGTKKETTSSADAASNFQLIKLSGAIYGPSDEMVISKDQVLYYQNLDADSKASKLIDTDK